MIKVAVSGGFDPIHVGHLRYIKEAKKLGDYLIVILTRDEQLVEKKGYVFMSFPERKEILESIVGVDEVVENTDSDITSRESITLYQPDIFAKGGDTWDVDSLPEATVCQKYNIEIRFGVGGFEKAQSSSQLVKQAKEVK